LRSLAIWSVKSRKFQVAVNIRPLREAFYR
jgi:hypothetical protein